MMAFCARNSVSASMACISTHLEWGYTYTELQQIAGGGEQVIIILYIIYRTRTLAILEILRTAVILCRLLNRSLI